MSFIKCPHCGWRVSDQATVCIRCKYPLAYHRDPGDDPAMRMLLPVGRSGWAIAAGYLGLISVLCIPSPFALVCGILAINEMRRNPKKHGMGRAVFGIVMGSFGCVALAIGLVVAIAHALR